MQATTQTRLRLSACDAQLLDRMADLYGSMKRKLYPRMAAQGGKAKSHKTALSREHSLSARMFNAIAIDLQGNIDSTCELLAEERKSLSQGIAHMESQLDARRAQFARIDADHLRMKLQREAKLRARAHQNAVTLARRKSKRRKTEARLVVNVPGICFGTRKRVGQQHHLGLTKFSGHEEWRRDWQDSRSHKIFFVGSKDETAGNQLCQLRKASGDTYALEIRVPDRLLSPGDGKYLIIRTVTFGYDREALDAALKAGTALSWWLLRDERGWRAFVSFNHQRAESATLDAAHGAIGIDFNVDHLAVTETDPFGNLLRTRGFPLLREDASSRQRNAVLSDALTAAVTRAREIRKPVVAEDLDFPAKRRRSHNSVQRERACSPGCSMQNAGICSKRSASEQESN